jgi:transcriptional regulator GlxA family with amidase domain
VFLVYPRFQSLDLAGPFEVFAGANTVLGREAYVLTPVAMQAGPVRSESGLQIVIDVAAGSVRTTAVDTLVVVGGNGVIAARDDAELVRWVRRAARHAARVASVCSGTFVLAQAGLLDGTRVTTHWSRAERLALEYPAIEVDADPIYTRSGKVWTSAGVTSGIDLALAMVEDDHGVAVAQGIARGLVMFLRRPGGQSQFATGVWSGPATDRPVRVALDRVQADPAGDCSVQALAATASMSERHFSRVFAREVGCTPAVYVERIRVEAARRALEQSDDGLARVATRCGFGSAETMRRAFLRRLGVPPSDYRDRFSVRPLVHPPVDPPTPVPTHAGAPQ